MASTLSWLDYPDAERRALGVIELFRDRDTRDELGLGAIRDPRLLPSLGSQRLSGFCTLAASVREGSET